MLARLSAFVIWAFVAAAAMFWGLRLLVQPAPAPANLTTVGQSLPVAGDLSRLFGVAEVAAAPSAPPESSRFKLLGVMAGKEGAAERSPGVALISVDGKPARTYRPGARVDGQLVIQNLGLRTAVLGPAEGPASFTLEVPPLSAAATGTLPPPSMGGDDSSASTPPTSAAPPDPASPPQAQMPSRGRPGGPMDSMMR